MDRRRRERGYTYTTVTPTIYEKVLVSNFKLDKLKPNGLLGNVLLDLFIIDMVEG